jgi:hypothetical protein
MTGVASLEGPYRVFAVTRKFHTVLGGRVVNLVGTLRAGPSHSAYLEPEGTGIVVNVAGQVLDDRACYQSRLGTTGRSRRRRSLPGVALRFPPECPRGHGLHPRTTMIASMVAGCCRDHVGPPAPR